MAFVNNKFYGELHGKTIRDFSRGLDYSLDRVEDRVELVTKVLMTQEVNKNDMVYSFPDGYFEDLFEQTYDVALSREGVYWVEDMQQFLPYAEFISWCKSNSINPIDYLEIQDGFGELEYEDEEADKGTWNYGGLNTSHIKLVINTTDDQYTESNIAKELEMMADYILAKDQKEDNQEYVFYTDEELFKQAIKEKGMLKDLEDSGAIGIDEPIIFLRDKGINYNKEKKQIAEKRDLEIPTIKEFTDLQEHFSNRLSAYNVIQHKIKKHEHLTEEDLIVIEKNKTVRKQLRNQVGKLRDDIVDTKDALRGTIYFKRVSVGKGGIDWDMIDLNNVEHMKALLYMKPTNDLTNDLACIVDYVTKLLAKVKLTEQDREIISMLQRGIRISIIAESLGLADSTVHEQIDWIVNRLTKLNQEIEEDVYYLNTAMGQYKTCRKCGQVKLVTTTYFRKNSTSKDGYRATCKECEAEARK